ncbi:MAG: uncharacterized protein QOJ19_4157 [Acidimicrobiia bacterium]|nr:uncharacterized protein [Acidimicrobiia bacterium]
MTGTTWLGVALVGLLVGFMAGLFGKGGSAIATPLLHALGIPAAMALAAPLPATIPSTLAATAVYLRQRLVQRQTFLWSVAFGVPATILGALLSGYVSADMLVRVTDVIIVGLGVRLLLRPSGSEASTEARVYRVRLVAVAVFVGVCAGLLANSGGFLLAPLYLAVLHSPLKSAFGTSLAVASMLAVPGTLVHWALGHLDWSIVLVFAVTSIPGSYVGARAALRSRSDVLERAYGGALTLMGTAFLILR